MAMKKYNEMFNTETFQLDSERVYPLPFQITLDTKLREIQYKILYRICYTKRHVVQIWFSWLSIMLLLQWRISELRFLFF